jgi:hypothetical protein
MTPRATERTCRCGRWYSIALVMTLRRRGLKIRVS